jgi:glycosyltransferase involved in cell wall biosynthesis
MSIYGKEKSKYFDLCLKSIYCQSSLPAEIVLVQDGPLPPQLLGVIEKYSGSTSVPLRTIKNKKNLGLGLALKIGLAHCRCKWVARMDSDDICHPERFKIQSEFIKKNPKISAVGGFVAEFKEKRNKILGVRKVPLSKSDVQNFSRFRNPMNHMTVMFKSQDVERAGGYRDFPFFEDYDLWIRMLAAGMEMRNIPRILVWARFDQESLKRRHGLNYFCKEVELFNEMRSLKYIDAFDYWKALVPRFFIRLSPKLFQTFAYKFFARDFEFNFQRNDWKST